MARLLVVDDEKGIRDALVQVFEYEGHEVAAAEDGREGIDMASELRPDVIFLDVKMPGLDGLDVLGKLREEDPSALVVMISGHGTIDTAVEATRKGAYDFLEKPLDNRSPARHAQSGPRAQRPHGEHGGPEEQGREPLRDRRQLLPDSEGARARREGVADRGPGADHR